MRVLFIDGTWADQMHEIDDGVKIWNVPIPAELNISDYLTEGIPPFSQFDMDTYTILKVPMFGREINLGIKDWKGTFKAGVIPLALMKYAVKELDS